MTGAIATTSAKTRRSLAARTRIAVSLLVAGATLSASAAAAESLTIGGTGIAIAIARALGGAFVAKEPGTIVDVPASVGSGGGIQAVIHQQFDLSFSARPLKDRERDLGLEGALLCRTPLVLAVSSQVHGDVSVSRAELLNMYTRRLDRWPDGTPITLLFRPPSETAATMLEKYLPSLSEAFRVGRERRGAIVAYSDQEMMDIGERLPGSLVFGALAAMRAEKRALRPLSLDGVSPSLANLADGSYPLAFDLWAITGPQPRPVTARFLQFVMSEEAAELLQRVDCLPVHPDTPIQPGHFVPKPDRYENDAKVAQVTPVR